MGRTVKAPDQETIETYLLAKPGFSVKVVDSRLWVFRSDSEELAEYEMQGELAKHVIRPGVGPGGMTLKAPDSETLLAYMAAQEGFKTIIKDGRIWVFRKGCAELADFKKNGELAKHVIRTSAGPMGATVKAPDTETLDAYLRTATSG